MQPQDPQYQQPPATQPIPQPTPVQSPGGSAPQFSNGPTTYVVTQPQQSFAVTPEKKSPMTLVVYIVLGLVLASSAGLLVAVIILM